MVKPGFFGFVAKTKGYYNPKKKQYKTHQTTMDYLQQVIRRGYKNGRGKAALPFYTILNSEKFDIERVRYEQVNLVIDAVRSMRQNAKRVWAMYQRDKEASCGGAGTSDIGLFAMTCQIAFDLNQDCIDYIDSMRFSYSTMYWLLKCIESDQCSDIRNVLFNILFGAPNRNFYKAIRASVKPISVIVPDERGDIDIYGMKFKHTYTDAIL